MSDDDTSSDQDPADQDPAGRDPQQSGGAFNPFAGMPMFAELAKQLQGQGPLNWDAARQFALLGASGGQSEPNVDPTDRVQLAELANIVGPQVNDIGGFDIVFPTPTTATRSQWAAATLEAYRPLFTELATSLGGGAGDVPETTDPLAQMMANLNQLAGPGMLGMAVGSMVGSLSQRAFGEHDLPIPRKQDGVVLVPANIAEFARQFDLARDEVNLWVLAHEFAGHAVFSIAPVRDGLAQLVRAHVGAFQADPNALGEKLSGLEMSGDPMESVQQAFSDPEILLGAVSSPAQRTLQPALDAAVAMVVGYIDWIVDGVAVRLVGGDALNIASAARERRANAATEDVFVQRLLGIRIDAEQVRQGKEFIQGVVDRVGESELVTLLGRRDCLPTPNELAAPGLWIERVELSADGPA